MMIMLRRIRIPQNKQRNQEGVSKHKNSLRPNESRLSKGVKSLVVHLHVYFMFNCIFQVTFFSKPFNSISKLERQIHSKFDIQDYQCEVYAGKEKIAKLYLLLRIERTLSTLQLTSFVNKEYLMCALHLFHVSNG